MIKKAIRKFSLFDLIVAAMMAALGVAVKPIISPLVQIVTGPLFIPGGVVAGGIYMMFLVLGACLVRRRGIATFIATIQALLIIVTGLHGSHGILSLITYILPGIAVDLVLSLARTHDPGPVVSFICGIAANVAGSFLVNFIYFNLPLVPLLLSIFAATLSGGLGGLLAYAIAKRVRKIRENTAGGADAEDMEEDDAEEPV